MGASSLLPLSAAGQNPTITQEEIASLPKRDIVPIINVGPDFTWGQISVHDSIQIRIAHTVPLPGVPGELRFPLLDVQPADTVSPVIEGIVTERANGEPVAFTYALIESLGIGTSTDFDGRFTLKLPPNSNQKYILTIRYVGFEELDTIIDLTTNDTVKLELLELEMKVAHVMGIMVYVPRPTLNQRVKNAVNPANWYRKIKYKLAR